MQCIRTSALHAHELPACSLVFAGRLTLRLLWKQLLLSQPLMLPPVRGCKPRSLRAMQQQAQVLRRGSWKASSRRTLQQSQQRSLLVPLQPTNLQLPTVHC